MQELALLLRNELEIDAGACDQHTCTHTNPRIIDLINCFADDDQVCDLLALFDTNGDNRLAYAEFVKCLHTY